MKKIIILLSTALTLNLLAAPKAYFSHDGGLFSLTKLHINGKVHDAKWQYFDIREAVRSNPQALIYAQKHRKYALWSNRLIWLGLAAGIAYLIGPASEDKSISISELISYFGILTVGLIPASVMQSKSKQYLHKAVNEFNGVKDNKVTFLRYNIRF